MAVSAMPAAATWRTPSGSLWPVLVAMGIVATAGQLLLTRAYSQAPASRVGPFIYSSVIFAGALDWLFRGVVPDIVSWCGAALVITAGIMALRTAAARAPMTEGAPGPQNPAAP